jgi:hypothetical protein
MSKHPIFLFLSVPLSLIFVAAAALVILPLLRAQVEPAHSPAVADAYFQDSAADPSVSGLAIVAAVAATQLPQPIISLPAPDAIDALSKQHALPDYGLRWSSGASEGNTFFNRAHHARTVILLVSATPQQTIDVLYVVDGPRHLCSIKTRL